MFQFNFRAVVVKSIHLDTIAEPKLLHLLKLNHPNITKFNEISLRNDHFEISMEFCERGSLHSVIFDQKIIYSMKTVLTWAEQLFSALLYLEFEALIHGNIKPNNVLVTKDFMLKLTDLNGFHEINSNFVNTSSTSESFKYQSPEIVLFGRKMRSYSCDLYSTGLIIWEMIERRKVHERYKSHDGNFTAQSFFDDILTGKWILPLANCQHEIVYLIDECTGPDSRERPKIEIVEQAVRVMNEQCALTFEPTTSYQQKQLIHPIGFNRKEFPVAIDDYDSDIPTTSQCVVPDNERVSRIEKMIPDFDLIKNIDFLRKKFDDYFAMTPETFMALLPFYIDQEAKETLVKLIENLTTLPSDYFFLYDEWPNVLELKNSVPRLIELIEPFEGKERDLKVLMYYIEGQIWKFRKNFAELHFKYRRYFREGILEITENSKSDEENLNVRVKFGKNFKPKSIQLNLRIYFDEIEEIAWILMSRKSGIFKKIDLSEIRKFEGYFSGGFDEFHRSDGVILKSYRALGFNEFTLRELLKLRGKLGESDERKAPLFLNIFSKDSKFPFIQYFFQLQVSPMKWPFIMYTGLTREQVKEIEYLHNWMKIEIQGIGLTMDELPKYPNSPNFFFFLKTLCGKFLVLDLPSIEKQKIKCFHMETTMIAEVELSFDEIDLKSLVKIELDELQRIILGNRKSQKSAKSTKKSVLKAFTKL